MRRTRRRQTRGYGRAVAGVVVLALTLTPAAAPAQQKAWDQERVTELAQMLAAAVAEVRHSVRREQVGTDAQTVKVRAYQRYMDTLRRLENSTKQLAKRLADGGGYEETLPIARKIGTQLRDAAEDGSKVMTTAWTAERIRPAEAILAELSGYYEDASVTPAS